MKNEKLILEALRILLFSGEAEPIKDERRKVLRAINKALNPEQTSEKISEDLPEDGEVNELGGTN